MAQAVHIAMDQEESEAETRDWASVVKDLLLAEKCLPSKHEKLSGNLQHLYKIKSQDCSAQL